MKKCTLCNVNGYRIGDPACRNGEYSIPLWHPNTIIRYYVKPDNLVEWQYALLLSSMKNSADHWGNGKLLKVNNGVPSFRESDLLTATFVVEMQKEDDGNDTLATAFLPSNAYNLKLKIYPLQFSREWLGTISDTLAHELGHILGFRHPFDDGMAVRVHPDNRLSVMTYGTRCVQRRDLLVLIELYEKLMEDFKGIAVRYYTSCSETEDEKAERERIQQNLQEVRIAEEEERERIRLEEAAEEERAREVELEEYYQRRLDEEKIFVHYKKNGANVQEMYTFGNKDKALERYDACKAPKLLVWPRSTDIMHLKKSRGTRGYASLEESCVHYHGPEMWRR